MSSNAALKLVKNDSSFVSSFNEALDLSSYKDGHSLHYVISLGSIVNPAAASHFISNYSNKGELIFDPFCGVGTTALEALIQNRNSIATDINPLAVKITNGKIKALNFADFLFFIQTLNLQGLVATPDIEFESFYHPKTLSEIIVLKNKLAQKNSDFLELMALSILHGKSSGHLSVPTFPQVSINSEQQNKLNIENGFFPEHRSVVPRLIKKAANVLKDGLPLDFLKNSEKSYSFEANALNLGYLKNNSVDLIFTAPPEPSSKINSKIENQWIRQWFNTSEDEDWSSVRFNSDDEDEWLDFMNTVLVELCRVLKNKKNLVLEVDPNKISTNKFINMIKSELRDYYVFEGQYHSYGKQTALQGTKKHLKKDYLVLRKI